MDIGRNSRFLYIKLSDTIATIAYVLGNGLRKEHRLLTDNADVISQPFDVQLANVDAVDLNGALQRIIKPLNKLHDRALPTAT